MLISATAFQNEISRYFEVVQHEDIYIQKHGKIIAILSNPKKEKTSLKSLKGILKDKAPEDITMKDIKEERLKEKYGV